MLGSGIFVLVVALLEIMVLLLYVPDKPMFSILTILILTILFLSTALFLSPDKSLLRLLKCYPLTTLGVFSGVTLFVAILFFQYYGFIEGSLASATALSFVLLSLALLRAIFRRRHGPDE